MILFTIGFTKKTADTFFSLLRNAKVKKLIDIRLNNSSQLAGFTKKDDLEYFTNVICGIPYTHMLELAPTQEILDEYKKDKGEWSIYEQQFLALMTKRKVENLNRNDLDGGCLLCSEPEPHQCHRRLVAEYLRDKWGDVEIVHL
jgi:uncharacterized protein (DUF488 family)